MIILWLFVWALAGAPTVGGWWLATLIVSAFLPIHFNAEVRR